MKRKLLLTMALMAALPGSIWATDVYFYNAQSQGFFSVKKDVRRLTFSPYGMTVVFNDGRKMEYVKADDVDYFKFKDGTVTGISSTAADGQTGKAEFRFDGSDLRVVSEAVVRSVDVFSINGLKVATAENAGTGEATVAMGSCAPGIYIAKAVAGGKVYVYKFVKR